MKYFFLCTFLIAHLWATAQYAPFPTPGLVFGAIYHCNMYDCQDYVNVSMRFEADTVLCGKQWADFSYYFLRAEDGKYWALYNPGDCASQVLLYDFTKNTGDTIHLNDLGDVVVEQTSMITLNNGAVRKKMVLKDLNPLYTTHYTWVDGIGDIERDFFRSRDFEGGYGQLICVRDATGLIYYNPVVTLDCDSLLCPVPWSAFNFSCNGKTFEFSNQSYNANSARWDFGDGTTSTATNPVHTYTTPGCYTVTLTTGSACLPTTYTSVQSKKINVDALHYWEKTTHQPPVFFYDVQFFDPQHAWGMGEQTIWKTNNGGITWENVSYPGPARRLRKMQFRDFEHGIFTIKTLDSTDLTRDDLLWTNDGISFSIVTVAPHKTFTGIERVNDTTAVVAVNYVGIFTTKDGGVTWTQASQLGGVSLITDFESPDGQTIYFQARQNLIQPYSGAWGKSTDGLNWTVTPIPNLNGAGDTKISFINLMEGWLCSGGIYHTVDGGEHWDFLAGLFSNGSKDVHFADALHGWTSSYMGGIYGTSDGGLTWTQQACVLKDAYIRGLNALSDTTALILAEGDLYRYTTHPHTEYSCGVVETTPEPSNNGLTVTCMPNPANGLTTIVWDRTTNAAKAVFILYNTDGQVLRQINLTEDSGNTPLLTASLPAGIYLWRCVDNAGKTAVGKLVVVH